MSPSPQSSAVRPHRLTLAAPALLLVVAGCGGASVVSPADPPPASPASGNSSSPPKKSSSSASGNATTAAPRQTSCADATGDGGPADLTAVAIAVDADGARVSWTTTQAVQSIVDSSSTALFSATVVRADGNQVFQLGVKSVDGDLDAPFVFDTSTTQQTDTDDVAQVDASTITATFPADTITALGPGWTWSAATSVDGTDVDRCPDASGSVLDPPMITAGP